MAISAVEPHYYWPEPVSDMREILRVLKPKGTLAVIAEVYKGEKFAKLLTIPMHLLRARYLTIEEHRQLLTDAGFVDVTIDAESNKGWICCVAWKPAFAT